MIVSPKVVGLTGGIATGKSTVAHLLRRMGVPVVDADRVARDVVAPGEPALDRIVDVFGPGALTADGALDRPAMRRRIMADPTARGTLEGITHPAIRNRITHELETLARAGHRVAVVEAALLVETGSWRDYAVLIVVSASPELQLARLVARDGLTPAEARAMLQAQLPLADKEAVATHVIRNDSDLAALEVRTREVWAAVTPS